MGKGYYETKLEAAQVAYKMLSERFGQKCLAGEINAGNVAIYSTVLENARNEIDYQLKNAENEKREADNVPTD